MWEEFVNIKNSGFQRLEIGGIRGCHNGWHLFSLQKRQHFFKRNHFILFLD